MQTPLSGKQTTAKQQNADWKNQSSNSLLHNLSFIASI